MTQSLPSSLWRASEPLVLASKSGGRRLALGQTGIPFDVSPANVDERAIESKIRDAGGDADAVAAGLARAKALATSINSPGRYVIGADQVASCEGRLFGKPPTMADAASLLRFLSGRKHRLHSAIALAKDDRIIFETVEHADLTMRPLSEEFIAAYLTEVGDAALTSAGAYQIEGRGAHLFTKIQGDHWTIIGLPLMPLLAALRGEGALLS